MNGWIFGYISVFCVYILEKAHSSSSSSEFFIVTDITNHGILPAFFFLFTKLYNVCSLVNMYPQNSDRHDEDEDEDDDEDFFGV